MKLLLGNYECSVNTNYYIYKRASQSMKKRHCSNEYSFFVSLSKSIRIDVANKEYVLNDGEGILVAPNEYYSLTELSSDCSYFFLRFSMQSESPHAESLSKIPPCTKIKLPDSALSVCRSLHADDSEKAPYRREMINAKYTVIMTELLRIIIDDAENKEELVNESPKRYFPTIDAYFQDNIFSHTSEQVLADKLNISSRQLNRILMTHYGMNFRQKLLSARMDRAAWLLRTTDLSIGEIGEAVGYMTDTSFYKAFKAHYNTTPRMYRNSFTKKKR